MSIRPILALLAAAWLLAGCQRTVFENAPAAAEACDPTLVGRWLSQDDDTPENAGEIEATIGADCSLDMVEHKKDGDKRYERTQLSTARVGGQKYLWLDAAWSNRAFDVDSTPLDHAGDVYLFAYRLRRDELSLASPPERALAHKVLDKDIPGEVLLHEDELTVRVTGDSATIRKVLGKHRLYRFDDDALRFRRAPQEKTP